MRLILLLFFVSTLGCSHSSKRKITFDISVLDNQGLRGKGDGKVAVPYEFVIPRNEIYRREVAHIDTTVQFLTAPGRIGASEEEYLCIGNTHQEGYKRVLRELRRLPYIEKIIETHFE